MEDSICGWVREEGRMTDTVECLVCSGIFKGGTEKKNPSVNAGDATENRVQSLGREGPLEKEMATPSSILAWKVPWTGESSGLPSMGLQRVRHNWVTEDTQLPMSWVLGDAGLSFFPYVDTEICSGIFGRGMLYYISKSPFLDHTDPSLWTLLFIYSMLISSCYKPNSVSCVVCDLVLNYISTFTVSVFAYLNLISHPDLWWLFPVYQIIAHVKMLYTLFLLGTWTSPCEGSCFVIFYFI